MVDRITSQRQGCGALRGRTSLGGTLEDAGRFAEPLFLPSTAYYHCSPRYHQLCHDPARPHKSSASCSMVHPNFLLGFAMGPPDKPIASPFAKMFMNRKPETLWPLCLPYSCVWSGFLWFGSLSYTSSLAALRRMSREYLAEAVVPCPVAQTRSGQLPLSPVSHFR